MTFRVKINNEIFQEVYFNRILTRNLIRLNGFTQIELKLSKKIYRLWKIYEEFWIPYIVIKDGKYMKD